jgi:hypothetical protein
MDSDWGADGIIDRTVHFAYDGDRRLVRAGPPSGSNWDEYEYDPVTGWVVEWRYLIRGFLEDRVSCSHDLPGRLTQKLVTGVEPPRLWTYRNDCPPIRAAWAQSPRRAGAGHWPTSPESGPRVRAGHALALHVNGQQPEVLRAPFEEGCGGNIVPWPLRPGYRRSYYGPGENIGHDGPTDNASCPK